MPSRNRNDLGSTQIRTFQINQVRKRADKMNDPHLKPLRKFLTKMANRMEEIG